MIRSKLNTYEASLSILLSQNNSCKLSKSKKKLASDRKSEGEAIASDSLHGS